MNLLNENLDAVLMASGSASFYPQFSAVISLIWVLYAGMLITKSECDASLKPLQGLSLMLKLTLLHLRTHIRTHIPIYSLFMKINCDNTPCGFKVEVLRINWYCPTRGSVERSAITFKPNHFGNNKWISFKYQIYR